VVHVASSWRSHGSEAKDSRFDGIGCGIVEVKPNYPSLNVIFLLAHRGILVFCFRYKSTHRAVVGGIPLPPPLTKVFILLGVDALHVLEKREVKRDIPNLLKSGRIFEWFSHLVNS
jgi:hypothetical protein